MDLCSITITGNLGRDAERKAVGPGLVEMNVACGRRAKVDGKWQDETVWFRCQVWGKRGELIAQYLTKGARVGVTGSLSVRSYTAKDGAAKQSLEIDASDVALLGGKRDAEPQRAAQFSRAPDPEGDGSDDAFHDANDLPF
jgi:single-strand DNA-binding protein